MYAITNNEQSSTNIDDIWIDNTFSSNDTTSIIAIMNDNAMSNNDQHLF